MTDTEPADRDNPPVASDLDRLPPWAPGEGSDTADGGVFVGAAGAEDRYRLVRRLGQGLESELWEAEDLFQDPGDPCVVRLVRAPTPAESEKQQVRWLARRQLLLPLQHPSIIGVRDMFQAWRPHPAGACTGVGLPPESRQVYVAVMDLAKGSRLAELGAEAPIDERLRWIAQIADAVAYLHQQDPPVLHRDIRPINIVVQSLPSSSSLTSDRPESRAILVDFGLVRAEPPDTSAASEANLGFCAPEVLADTRRTSMASDVYNLAATACFAVVGEAPLAAPDQLEDQLLSVLSTSIAGPEAVVGTLKAMLQPDPNGRPPAEALSAVLQPQQPTTPTVMDPLPPKPPAPRRKLIPALIAGLVAVVGIAVLVAILTRSTDTPLAQPAPSTSSGEPSTTDFPTSSSSSSSTPSTSVDTTMPSTPTNPLTPDQITAALLTKLDLEAIIGQEFVVGEGRGGLKDPVQAEICSGTGIAAQPSTDGHTSFDGIGRVAGSGISSFPTLESAQSFITELRASTERCGLARLDATLGDETVRFGEESPPDSSLGYTYDWIFVRRGVNVLQVHYQNDDSAHQEKVEAMATQLTARLP